MVGPIRAKTSDCVLEAEDVQPERVGSTLDTVTPALGCSGNPSLIDTEKRILLGIDFAVGGVDVLWRGVALLRGFVGYSRNDAGSVADDVLGTVTYRNHDPATEEIVDSSVFALGEQMEFLEYFYRQTMRLRIFV